MMALLLPLLLAVGPGDNDSAFATHDEILVAVISVAGLLACSIFPLIVVMLQNRRTIAAVREQMPSNGARLWEMVQKIDDDVSQLRLEILRHQYLYRHERREEIEDPERGGEL